MSVYPPRLVIAPASYHSSSSYDPRSARHSDTRSSRHPSDGAPRQTYSFVYPGSHHSGVAGVPSTGLSSGSGAYRGSVASNQGSGGYSMIPPIYPSDSISQRGSSAGSPRVYGPVAPNALTRGRGNDGAVYSYGPAVPVNDYALYNLRPTQRALPSPQNHHSSTPAPRSSVTVHVFPHPPPLSPSPCHVCGTGLRLGQYPMAQRYFVVPVMMINCPCTHAATAAYVNGAYHKGR